MTLFSLLKNDLPPRLCWAAVLLTLLASCEQPAATHPEANASSKQAVAEIPKATTVKPARKNLSRRTEQPGQIQPFLETAVFAKVTGYVESVLVDIGDTVEGPKYSTDRKLVKAGQSLAVLSVPELDEEVNQKTAAVAQAKAEVDQSTAAIAVAIAMKESADSAVQEATASEARTQAAYDRWKSESDRITALAQSKAVTAKVAEETLQQFKSSDAARSEVAARIQSARAKASEAQALVDKAKSDQKAAEAKLQVAEADVGRVQAMAGYKTITAPFDGVVTVRNIDPGHLAHASQGANDKPLFKVVAAQKVRVFLDVPEADAVFVEQHREAKIRVPALANEIFPGEVARTAWTLNSETRTLKVEIDIPNGHGRLRPGMYAYVDLLIAEKRDALAVPKSAVLTTEGGPVCLTVDDQGKVIRHAVQTGFKTATEVEVVKGLSEHDNVISVNPGSFQEGQTVDTGKNKK